MLITEPVGELLTADYADGADKERAKAYRPNQLQLPLSEG
jgi:hypothetical protein